MGGAADGLHLVERLLREVPAVRVDRENVHVTLVYLTQDVEEATVCHRFAARDLEAGDSAVSRLVQQRAEILERPFRHQGGVVGGIEAVQAVEVALPGDHEVHHREACVVALPIRRPHTGSLTLLARFDQSPHHEEHDHVVRLHVVLAVGKEHDGGNPFRQRKRLANPPRIDRVADIRPASQRHVVCYAIVHGHLPRHRTERIVSGYA